MWAFCLIFPVLLGAFLLVMERLERYLLDSGHNSVVTVAGQEEHGSAGIERELAELFPGRAA